MINAADPIQPENNTDINMQGNEPMNSAQVPTPPSFPTHNPMHAAPMGGLPTTPKFPDPTKNLEMADATQASNPVMGSAGSPPSSLPPVPPAQATIKTGGFGWKKIAAIVAVFVVLLGSAAGYYLTQYTMQDVRQEASEDLSALPTGCASCSASCNDSPSCYVSCTDPAAPLCSRHTKTFVCDGKSDSGCGDLHPSYRPDLSNDSGQMPDLSNPANWCKTVQLDAYVQGGNPESNARVAYIGDKGEFCVDFTDCNPDDLDWVCGEETPEAAACESMTGTLKTVGTVATDTTSLSYTFNLTNPAAATRIDPTINPIYAGNNGWVGYTQLLPPFPANATGTVTFKQLRDKLIAAGQYTDIAKINSQGIKIVANVIQTDGSFCDGGGKWVGGSTPGQPCTNNCLATVKLATGTTPPVTCNETCVYGATFDQCTTEDPSWSCQLVIADPNSPDTLSPRCRLTANPSSATCEEAPPTQEVPISCVKVGGELRATNPLIIPNTTAAKSARKTYNTTAKHGTLAASSVEYVINKIGGSKKPTIIGARDQITAPSPVVPGQEVTVPNPARDMSFSSWESALVSAGYTSQEIQKDGISYYARVRDSAQDYCDTTGLWVGGPKAGKACSPQALCSGMIKLAIASSPSPSPSVSPSPSPSVSPSPSPSVSPSPSPSVSPSPTPTPTPAPGCNETCTTNADCSNAQHICVDTNTGKRCRLENYINSETCSEPAATPQPELPQTLPKTGPEEWLKWLRAGLVTLGVGTFLFLLL